MGIKIAIDVSRGRSGGAKAHLIGFIEEAEPESLEIDEIHVWGYKELLEKLPVRDWLHKHNADELEKSLLSQIRWQRRKLRQEIKKHGCHVLLSTDAGTVYIHNPSVVMSRDMLSFERSEISRYKKIIPWLRLFVLRFVQSRSLKRATGALFLTQYAADMIQSWTGPISNYRIIPHGVGKIFKENHRINNWPLENERAIRCLYISNTAMYKHQWHVMEAFSLLREEGYNVFIEFVGGGHGESKNRLNETMARLDPDSLYSKQEEFLKHHELPQKLASADLFVFASSCENMPNTLVEAMACGLPIACSKLGPMPEILRDGGAYFHPEVPESIKEAIKQLIDNREQRELFAKKAKGYSEEYSWKRCSNETLQYLVDIHNSASK